MKLFSALRIVLWLSAYNAAKSITGFAAPIKYLTFLGANSNALQKLYIPLVKQQLTQQANIANQNLTDYDCICDMPGFVNTLTQRSITNV